ncbi:hypothetical protein [Streptomyces filamentosus]|uniref:hypothetical protein n=1 Tax=Streptomyces filamentosus TaxID=67294 RepID=UPI003411C960
MNARPNAGLRTTARQFALALTACLAVGGGAALVVAPQAASAPSHTVAGVAGDPLPTPTMTTTEDNGWNGPTPAPTGN